MVSIKTSNYEHTLSSEITEESPSGFFRSSHPSYQYDSFEPLWPRMSSRKVRKIATVMAGSTGAGVP